MKLAARISLAIVVLLAGFLVLPRPASRVLAPDAFGQIPTGNPTKLPDNPLKTATPTISPTKTKTPDPDPTKTPDPPDPDPTKEPGGGGGDDNGSGDGNNTGSGKGSTTGAGNGAGKNANKAKNKNAKNANDAGSSATGPGGYSGPFSATGEFTTEQLQLVAARLRARGLSDQAILQRVYAPFIIGGPAAWTNTWGAPRYGPGPIVRTHEGQDVFCKYGDPVLASEAGTIEFDDGGLGGRVARLYRKDGSYWYYAHLSGWNTKEFNNGDEVEVGDVIGYCGNSGNAITTPPHVHFGWYQANGDSKDPMGMLVKWLREAERNAGIVSEKVFGKSIAELAQTQSLRRFGDGFAPDISELKVSSEALLAASSSPGAGAFGLAEAALQAALASQTERVYDPTALHVEEAGSSESRLAELLGSTSSSASGDASD